MKVVDKSNVCHAWTETRIDQDGNMDMQHFENVDGIMRENAYLRSLDKSEKTKDGWRFKARLSPLMYHELMKQGIVQDQKRFRRWLNDPENSKWLITEGKM